MVLQFEFVAALFSLVLLFVFALKLRTNEETTSIASVFVSNDTSVILKGIACLVIVMHHFALRRMDCNTLITSQLVFGGVFGRLLYSFSCLPMELQRVK
ncbi:hypothetical protein [Phocaeicola sp.]